MSKRLRVYFNRYMPEDVLYETWRPLWSGYYGSINESEKVGKYLRLEKVAYELTPFRIKRRLI